MVHVKKASGELEEFSERKVRDSLQRAGASPELIEEIIQHVTSELYEGISSEHIYTHIFDLLRNKRSVIAARYNLKRAVMELGPSGYPFEKFFAGVLRQYGFEATTNNILEGACVKHEVDVIAKRNNDTIMIECKFHNHVGTKSKIRDVLYTYARYLDVKEKYAFTEAWLVTNTKVTSDVISYAQCKGMKVVAWNYPSDFSLRHLIEQSNLHPVTALDSLSHEKKQDLLRQGLVFVKDLKEGGEI